MSMYERPVRSVWRKMLAAGDQDCEDTGPVLLRVCCRDEASEAGGGAVLNHTTTSGVAIRAVTPTRYLVACELARTPPVSLLYWSTT